jgi:RecB family exonuclease
MSRACLVHASTGKRPKERYEDEAFSAMRFYALLLAESGTQPHKLRLVYLSKTGREAVITRDVDDAVIAKTRKENVKLIQRIRDAYATDNWPTQTGPLCPWCDFKDMCPAFSGQAPEQTEVRLNPW